MAYIQLTCVKKKQQIWTSNTGEISMTSDSEYTLPFLCPICLHKVPYTTRQSVEIGLHEYLVCPTCLNAIEELRCASHIKLLKQKDKFVGLEEI